MLQSLELPEHPYKRLLQKFGIKQAAAARVVGVSVPSLSQYLLGYRPMPANIEEALANLIAECSEAQE